MARLEHVSATIGYSSDVFGTRAEGYYYELRARTELPAALDVEVGFGFYDLSDAFAESYGHFEAGLARSFGRIAVCATYHRTFADAGEIFPERTSGSRIALAISIAL